MLETKFKVLIVDDDPVIIQYHSTLLTQHGIQNTAVSAIKEIEKTLHEFKPDIILMDLNMPECSGSEVAATIRQQKIYEDIPIMYLSSVDNISLQLDALSVGADDFIIKGAEPLNLIRAIRNRASRYKKIRSTSVKDNLTGAFNVRYMQSFLERNLENAKQNKQNFVIATVKIANLGLIQTSYGLSVCDQLLKNLFVLLSNQLDSTKVISLWSSFEFLIFFPTDSEINAQAEMERISEKFKNALQYANGMVYNSSILFLIKSSKGKTSLQELID